MAVNLKKSKKQFETIDEYIATFPPDVKRILEELRQAIRDSAPNAEEAISYQIPTFKLNGILVHFAAFKNHIGFYPTPSAINKFKKELSPYEVTRGTIKFPINKPIPFDLIKRIVIYRVNEQLDNR